MITNHPDLSQTKAFFIDFDGTLVNTIPLLKNVYYDFLKSHGIEGNDDEFNFLNGQKLTEIISYLKNKYHFESSKENLMSSYEQRIREHFFSELEVFPGAVDFLRKAVHYGKVYIVSSTIKDLLLACVESLDLLGSVDDILSGDDINEGKPHPEIYLKALKLAGVKPEEAVVFEDSDNGVEAALAAHIPTILIHQKEVPYKEAGLYSAKDWHEVKSWFGEGK